MKGRPTLYKPEYAKKLIEFFNVPHTVIVEKTCYDKDGNPFIKEVEKPNKLPTFEAFAFSIGHHRETIINWADKHKDFFDAYKKAKDLQKDMLIYLGMIGLYNPTFTIFTAKNITDMKDRQEVANENINITVDSEKHKEMLERFEKDDSI